MSKNTTGNRKNNTEIKLIMKDNDIRDVLNKDDPSISYILLQNNELLKKYQDIVEENKLLRDSMDDIEEYNGTIERKITNMKGLIKNVYSLYKNYKSISELYPDGYVYESSSLYKYQDKLIQYNNDILMELKYVFAITIVFLLFNVICAVPLKFSPVIILMILLMQIYIIAVKYMKIKKILSCYDIKILEKDIASIKNKLSSYNINFDEIQKKKTDLNKEIVAIKKANDYISKLDVVDYM